VTKVTKPTIDAPGGPLPLFFGRSDDFPNPSVVLVHEMWGMNGNIQDIALRLAQETFYTVVVPDLWRGEHPEEHDEAKKLVMEKDMDQVAADVRAAVGWLATQRATTIGVIGFCMGGRLTWRLAQEDERLNAAVPFYGKVDIEPGKPIHCPVVAHFGGADPSTPPEYVEQVRAYLDAQPYATEVFVYEDAPHAFFNDTRDSYRQDAAELAWQRTLDFFRNELGE
jgi:carboxymethylenebutenolidase